MAVEAGVARWGDTFRAAAELYNAGSFYAAHEAWEMLWIAEPEPGPKLLLQGLIQIAAGFHQYFARRRPDPAARLLRRGVAKVVTHDAAQFGLSAFCERVAAVIAVIEGPAGREDPGSTGHAALRLQDVPRL